MTQEEKDLVLGTFECSPEMFSCGHCKDFVKPSDCKGCPVYSWGGFDPND